MKLDEFKALSEEDQATYLSSIENTQQSIDDLTAERDSFKKENAELQTQLDGTNKELKATKEMNFTLARKITTAPEPDAEQELFNFMKGFKN